MIRKILLALSVVFCIAAILCLPSCKDPCDHEIEYTEGKAPTCTEYGYTEGEKCKKCDKVFVYQKIIEKKGHTEETMEGEASTCTNHGFKDGKRCSECKEVLLPREELPLAPHTYESFSCTECGKKTVRFVKNGDSYVVAAYNGCEDKEIIIPSTYNGLPVTAIADFAFMGCYTVERITLPDSIKSIGFMSFAQCKNLKEFNMGNGVEYIDRYVFYYATRLESVYMSKSLKEVGIGAFAICSNIRRVEISDLNSLRHVKFASDDANPLLYGELYVNGVIYKEQN